MKTLIIKSTKRIEAINITAEVRKFVKSGELKEGICIVYTPHTTAGIIINEGADPDVMKDLLSSLNSLVPYNKNYRHIEGNSDSHIKASVIGNSRIIIFEDKELLLGTWEAIYFLEFDGPRTRKVYLTVR